MSIALSEDQVALAESVAKFAARHAPTAATRREQGDLAAGIRPAWWDALCKQGLLSLHLPARAGGDGAGLEELAVVLHGALAAREDERRGEDHGCDRGEALHEEPPEAQG